MTFSEWDTVFPDAACTTELVERLAHHSEIISVIAATALRATRAAAAAKAVAAIVPAATARGCEAISAGR